ncbi:LasU family protein [Companilactobacillus halodurans]
MEENYEKDIFSSSHCCFIILLIYGICQKYFLGGSWINYFVIGLTGLSAYPPVLLFIDGMAIGFREDNSKKKQNKLFYGIIIGLWVISVSFFIFLMGHN